MAELWSFIGALAAAVVLAVVGVGGYIAANAFAIGWRREARAVLSLHLLRWRWDDGLAKTRERQFWERRYFSAAESEPAVSADEWRVLTLALLGIPSDDVVSAKRWARRFAAVEFRSLVGLSEWAEQQTSVDVILRHWWWRSARERCGLTVTGWRHVGRPAFSALTEKLKVSGTPVLVWAPVVALALWGPVSSFRGTRDEGGDWIAYVGWVTAVAAVVAVVIPLGREALRMLRALTPDPPPPHARKLVTLAIVVAVSMFAVQHFGVMERSSTWVEGRVLSLPDEVQSWVGGALFVAFLCWSLVNRFRMPLSGRHPIWRWSLTLLTGGAFASLIVITLTGPRWLSPDTMRSAILAVTSMIAVTGALWGIQSAVRWGRQVWREKQVVDAAGGVDLGGFYPRVTLAGLATWVAMLISSSVVDPDALGGGLSIGMGLTLLVLTGGFFPQAILFALWRRRLRHGFERARVLEMEAVLADLESGRDEPATR